MTQTPPHLIAAQLANRRRMMLLHYSFFAGQDVSDVGDLPPNVYEYLLNLPYMQLVAPLIWRDLQGGAKYADVTRRYHVDRWAILRRFR